MPVIPALRGLRQEEHKLAASPGFTDKPISKIQKDNKAHSNYTPQGLREEVVE